jgi:hypothetical protein
VSRGVEAPHGVATDALVVAVLGAAGFIACSVPASPATRIDPAVALRYEWQGETADYALFSIHLRRRLSM